MKGQGFIKPVQNRKEGRNIKTAFQPKVFSVREIIICVALLLAMDRMIIICLFVVTCKFMSNYVDD